MPVVQVRARLALAIALAIAGVAGCAGSNSRMSAANSGQQVTGNDKGGRIPGGAGANTQASMRLVTAHCAQYGKKGFITRMEPPESGGLMVFECHEPKR